MNHLKLSPERGGAEFSVPQSQISEDLRAFYDKFRRSWAIARVDGDFQPEGRKIVDAVADLPFLDLKFGRALSFPWQRQDPWQYELHSGCQSTNYREPVSLAVKSSVSVAPNRHPEQAKAVADINVVYTTKYADIDGVNNYLFLRQYHPDVAAKLPEAFLQASFEPKEVIVALHFDPLAPHETTRRSPLQNHHVDRKRYVGIGYDFEGRNPDRPSGAPNTWLWSFRYPRYGTNNHFRGVKVEDNSRTP